MVKQVTSYKSSSGNTFETEREAWLEELTTLLAPMIGNDPITNQVRAAISENPHALFEVLDRLARLTPQATTAPKFKPVLDGVLARALFEDHQS